MQTRHYIYRMAVFMMIEGRFRYGSFEFEEGGALSFDFWLLDDEYNSIMWFLRE